MKYKYFPKVNNYPKVDNYEKILAAIANDLKTKDIVNIQIEHQEAATIEKCMICQSKVRVEWDDKIRHKILFVHGGSRVKIDPGWGSNRDCSIFQGFICDKCITKKECLGDIVEVNNCFNRLSKDLKGIDLISESESRTI